MKEKLLTSYDGDQLLGIPEAAEVLGSSPACVRELVNYGLLPAIGFGRLKRIRKFALNKFLEQYDGQDIFMVLAKARESGGAS